MLINVSTVLKNFDGEPLKEDMNLQRLGQLYIEALEKIQDEAVRDELLKKASELTTDLTLRKTLMQACGLGLSDSFTPEDRIALFKIAAKLPKEGDVDLESGDISLLKRAIGKVYMSPLVVGQCAVLLEGKDPFASAS